jgi:proton glutamate symport protein
MILFAGVFAVCTGYIVQPGKNMSSDPEIVKIVENSGGNKIREVTLDDHVEKVQSVSIVDFLVDTVPNNIFRSLSSANMLQIIVFCLIFSVACGIVSRADKKIRMAGVGDFLPIFHKINEKVLLFLPLGSFCLLATQLSTTSKSTFFTILSLALTMLAAIFGLMIMSSILLWKCSKLKYLESIKGMLDTLLMAFSTQSSIICVPKAVNAMEKLNFDKQTVELTIPLGVPLCQFATVCFYSIGTIFVVNIFNEQLTFTSYVFIIFASILTSLAASGVRGMLYYSLMTGILDPLGVPLGNTIALFAAVDPLVDPFCTMLQIYANCCCSAICCCVTEKREQRERARSGGKNGSDGGKSGGDGNENCGGIGGGGGESDAKGKVHAKADDAPADQKSDAAKKSSDAVGDYKELLAGTYGGALEDVSTAGTQVTKSNESTETNEESINAKEKGEVEGKKKVTRKRRTKPTPDEQ